jgi:effector-binding domain-containing protein
MTTATMPRPELRTVDEQLVAVILLTCPIAGIPDAMGTAFHELETAIRDADVEMTGPPFARYLEFSPEQITLQAGCPIGTTFPASRRVEIGSLPAGEVATVVHVGPYERLAETYSALNAWLADHGREPAGPMWEVYLTDPSVEPDPAIWRTEIFQPIR